MSKPVTPVRASLRQRTEVQVVADVIVRLMQAQVLRWDGRVVKRVCEVVGIEAAALRHAWVQAETTAYRPPTGRVVTTPVIPPLPLTTADVDVADGRCRWCNEELPSSPGVRPFRFCPHPKRCRQQAYVARHGLRANGKAYKDQEHLPA